MVQIIIRIFLFFLIPMSITSQARSHEGRLDFEIKVNQGNVCQEFSFHGERLSHLDQCVPVQEVINQKIEVVSLTQLLKLFEEAVELDQSEQGSQRQIKILEQAQEDPLNLYDVAVLSDENQDQVITNYKRLDIKHLSVIKADTKVFEGKEESRMHFVAAVDWEKKSGLSGVSYLQGDIIDLSEETLMTIIDSDKKGYVLKGLAETLKKRTQIMRISSKDGGEALEEVEVREKVAPVIAVELAFVLNLRLLRATMQFLNEIEEIIEDEPGDHQLEDSDGMGGTILRPSLFYEKPQYLSL